MPQHFSLGLHPDSVAVELTVTSLWPSVMSRLRMQEFTTVRVTTISTVYLCSHSYKALYKNLPQSGSTWLHSAAGAHCRWRAENRREGGGEKGGLINRLKTLTVIIISQVTDDCTTAADVEEKTTEGKGTERRGEERRGEEEEEDEEKEQEGEPLSLMRFGPLWSTIWSTMVWPCRRLARGFNQI